MKATIIRHRIYQDHLSLDTVIQASVGSERFFWLESQSSARPECGFTVEIGRPEALDYIREASKSHQHSIERF